MNLVLKDDGDLVDNVGKIKQFVGKHPIKDNLYY